MSAVKTKGQIAYELDLEFEPLYHDKTPRQAWDALPETLKDSWERNPTPRRQFHKELPKSWFPEPAFNCYGIKGVWVEKGYHCWDCTSPSNSYDARVITESAFYHGAMALLESITFGGNAYSPFLFRTEEIPVLNLKPGPLDLVISLDDNEEVGILINIRDATISWVDVNDEEQRVRVLELAKELRLLADELEREGQ